MHLINHACRIAVLIALASPPLRAQQTGRTVTMTGRVSGVAAVSAPKAARVIKGDAKVSAEAAGTQGLIISLSGRRGGKALIEIPVLLRSNVDFALTVSGTASGSTLSGLYVIKVGRAGAFVYPGGR